ESFEDEATARIMNENFVSIKVDMEERPDVDQIYMTFVQLTTGRGGWPMNVFLTPDKLPFFGGTYFPPTPRYGMASFSQILMSVAEAYRDRRDEILHSANDIVGELRRTSIADFEAGGISPELLDSAFQNFDKTFDSTNGGFGGAPKFPPSMSLEFLLRYYKRTGNQRALEITEKTARKMAEGGIYDQLGGGFHRYSVDAVWLVPHFEKMLYDNAQLVRVYLHLYQIAKAGESGPAGEEKAPVATASGSDRSAEFFARVAVETLEYVRREMLDPTGAFYSTQDADSEGEEGKFFVWTPEEIEKILGSEDAQVFNFFYDVSEEGNFEGKNILHVSYTTEAAARALKIDEPRLKEILERGRKLLFDEREKRVKPFRDEKVLTAWNGLMLVAFAEAAAVLGREDYLEIAKRNADFLLESLQADGQLLRTWKGGRAKLNAYIEDYANLADGLVELYQASGEARYLKEAKRLADAMITEFWDEENGGFYFTSNDHEELLVRNKDFFDNASPSGNSVAADVFQKLAKLVGDERYERFAATVLRLAAGQMKRYPQGFGRALSAMEFYVSSTKEVVVIADQGSELERAVWNGYLPNKVVVRSSSPTEDAGTIPLLSERSMIDGQPT
ncbi:MAG TPA: thioredoxin domain-containing protein, partial [Pyrinomonadaceae bacterium]|nr:thioredoxin domain-containing protein [Pyrinomonadaceae bacterium]